MKNILVVIYIYLISQQVFAQSCKPIANPAGLFNECTVTFNVTAGAGGGTDKIMRDLGAKLNSQGLKTVIVNNGAASGSILTTMSASSKDNCTFLVSSNGNISLNALRSDIQSPDIDKNFKPVALVATSPLLLAVRKEASKGKTNTGIPGFIENSKSKQLNAGNSGVGGIGHLLSNLLAQRMGAKPVDVPYKSSSAASIALQAGEIDYLFESPQTILTAYKSRPNELEILGSTGTKPFPFNGSEVKPLSQQSAAMKDLVALPYLGILSHATNISEEKRCAMSQLVNSILTDQKFTAQYKELGYEMGDGKPESLQNIMKQFDGSSAWAKVYADMGLLKKGTSEKPAQSGTANPQLR